MPKAVLHSQLKVINSDLVLGEDYILSKSLTIYLHTREVIWPIYDIEKDEFKPDESVASLPSLLSEKELKDKGLYVWKMLKFLLSK